MPTKHERIVNLLEKHHLDGLLIKQVANFAWATDGAASYVNTASTYGGGTLLITKDARYLITNNIEAPRFDQEEELKVAGWEFHVDRWFLASDTIAKLTIGLKLGADFAYPGAVDLSSELAVARSYLTPGEHVDFGDLSARCAQAMDETIRGVVPGMTEHQIAGLLARAAHVRGAQPIVNLIATDSRIYAYRHPLPTDKVMDKYAMLVLCGRRKGLVCSITRLVHFGQLSDELKRKSEALATIDATMINATRPGKTVADVFQAAVAAYKIAGYPDEYQFHHQGGPAGYDPREFLATPAADVPIGIGQAFAWNPSITGCKSEDTILVGEDGNNVMTAIDGWPTFSIEINGQVIERPAILTIEV
jgi:Xaa-Pro aminopeptidase